LQNVGSKSLPFSSLTPKQWSSTPTTIQHLKRCHLQAFLIAIVIGELKCDLLCFLDAYSDFHQIPMSREDQEHAAFVTMDVLFCYVSMPYGLKNALPTFVCAMHKTFWDLIRDLIGVYIDDIIVKIKSRSSLLDNLTIVCDRLCSTHTKLNPNKCVFEVSTEKLLGFLVSHWGIKANPEKIRAIEVMRPSLS
jgi:hypothetical protein